MRADNRGEGGILALLALQSGARGPRWTRLAVFLGLFGAALLYGDGVITPAISVLSAVEGLEVATPALAVAVVPITVVILVGLFAVQRYGTGADRRRLRPGDARSGSSSIGAAGLVAVLRQPSVVEAVSPLHAVSFFREHGLVAFLLLGSVVLVVTGGEALYADMGHFGAGPIRLAWFAVVLPALLLNYFGQGALLLESRRRRRATRSTRSSPATWLYPMVVLATLAAIIASQALISGAFSLTRQAVQLGYFPRVRIVHTSGETEGQIYIPEINWILMVACLALVLGFRSSGNLAAAYGIAVTGTMAITSVLFYGVARGVWQLEPRCARWRWSRRSSSSTSRSSART